MYLLLQTIAFYLDDRLRGVHASNKEGLGYLALASCYGAAPDRDQEPEHATSPCTRGQSWLICLFL